MGTVDIGVPGVVVSLNPYDDYRLDSFGASGAGVLDDRPSLLEAIATAVAAGGGAIYIPRTKIPGGFYRLDKDPAAPASINLENVTVPLVFYGDGPSSRLVFAGEGNGGAWSMFRVRASQNIKFLNLHMEMGEIENQDPDQGSDPHHLIHLDNSGSPARDIENIEIAGCTFRYTRGDHVRLWSETGRKTRNVKIHHNDMIGTGTMGATVTPGCRSCVQVQRNCEMVWVTHNYMTKCHKAEIDFEPTGSGAIQGFFVEHNIVNHDPVDITQAASAVALSGNGPTEPNSYSSFSNNKVFNGGLQMEQLDHCDINNNKIIDSRPHVNPSIHLNGRNSYIRVEGNWVRRHASNTSAAQPVILIQHGGGTTDVPSNIRVHNNDFVQDRYSSVMHIEGATETCVISDNRFWYNGPNYTPSDGNPATLEDGNIFHVLLESDGKTPIMEPTIFNNWFGGSGSTRACVQVTANVGDIGDLVVHENTFRSAGVGLELNRGSTFTIASLSLQGNRFYTTTPWAPVSGSGHTFQPVIAGNKGGVCTFEGAGSPEGVVAAVVGSTYIDKTNGRLYFKTTSTDITGWVQVAIP